MKTEDNLGTLQAACSGGPPGLATVVLAFPRAIGPMRGPASGGHHAPGGVAGPPGRSNGAARALQEALRLRAATLHAGGLLESASRYHAGWSRLMDAMSAGYAPGGAPAAVARPARLCLRG